MSTAWIDHPGAHIRLRSEHLEVLPPDTEGTAPLASIPLQELERLLITERVQISTQALAAVLRREVPVHVLDFAGRELGSFDPPGPPDGSARLRQYQRSLDGAWTLEHARTLVQAKLANQRRVLQRLRSNRERDIVPALAGLETSTRLTSGAGTLDALRGAEGAGSAAYFPAWAAFLPEVFPFEHRSTRPPHNAVNACLSFGYTLLYQEMTSALHACGLDPALGVLHVTDRNRWSLALDLMEPFRPAVVDALTLRLFSHEMVEAADFEPHDSGIYLNAQGRRTFLSQWEARLEREFSSEHVGHRTSLRQQVREQAMMWKQAVLTPPNLAAPTDAFRPFKLN